MVKDYLDSWEVADKIIACGFDTTSSNTGVNNGSCTILQNLLHQQLLWLACRHHILELIIGGAFTTIFGVTSGPEVTTFKILKTSWNSLNLGDRRLPDIPSYFKEDVADILEYVNSKLDQESHLPRGDYKELLELVKLILGGDIERKKGYSYTIQRPGADHHARWMAKGIYVLKMVMLQHQLKSHWTLKRKFTKMAMFVIFCYVKSWFSSPSLTTAAVNDINLFTRLEKFKKVDRAVSLKTLAVLNRHTWYLTEENIAIALFNTDISLERRSELAKKIYLLQIPSEEIVIRKPTLPSITSESILEDFVGGRSRGLFDLLGVSLEFLNEDNWNEAPEFSLVQAALKNLTPINDSSERALALATRFNTLITRTEASYQELMLVVESHCRKYSLKTKEDLKKLY